MLGREAQRTRDGEKQREDKSYEKRNKIKRGKEMKDKREKLPKEPSKVSKWRLCVKSRVRMQTWAC